MYSIDKLEAAIEAVAHPSTSAATPALWAELMRQDVLENGIGKTGRRLAAFVGQVSVESAGFSRIEENLNYSAERLCEVWPTRFEPDTAGGYAFKPEDIANRAYSLRMGNGEFLSGDGYRYRGAGLIQLTGKDNQLACAAALKIAPASIGDYLRTPAGALKSAYWFWNSRNLNSLADGWYITSLSIKINGGREGLEDRIEACNKVLEIVGQ